MPEHISGILHIPKRGTALLRDLTGSMPDVRVPAALVQQFRLPEGATVSGPLGTRRNQSELAGVDSVCGLAPEAFQARPAFADLVAINPMERFHLEVSGEISMRLIDLVAPIGKGTRGLIVAPPKAGKTTLLEHIAHSIRLDKPQTRIIVLLIDERPEEVTYFRRTVAAEVFASSSDQPVAEHISLAELVMAHVRVELECGHDIVVLVDSLTRLVRAFNRRPSSRGGRSLSGGLEAGALEIPRRFFGLARNVERGGSVTIIATALVETNSRMDELIYQEFKGTGNSEIVLDRSLAEAGVFPALNLLASSTRKEEFLYDPLEARRITQLRRSLATRDPKQALSALIRLLQGYPTNADLLKVIPD